MKFEPAEMLVSFTAALPRWKLQPGEMHGHSSEAEITTCQNIVSYTATLPRVFLVVLSLPGICQIFAK